MADIRAIPLGLTYDDVLLVPKRSGVKSRKEVSTRTRLSRNIELDMPIVASNMDTVCEDKMAIAMAREGGIGILHRFCSVEEQCAMLRKVKRAQSLLIEEPATIGPNATRDEAVELMKSFHERHKSISSLMVVDDFKNFLGILTNSDVTLAAPEAPVHTLMTKASDAITSPNLDISLGDARALLAKHKLHNLPIVNPTTGRLLGLVTAGDLVKLTTNRRATVDAKKRLRVGAAIGVKAADVVRAEALVEAGADVLVIDIAHGHSDLCIDVLRLLKTNEKTKYVDIIAGNIATKEGAEDLIKAGADGLKVGVGPGSICITRLVAGAGVPQVSALLDIRAAAGPAGVPVIADGGIRTAGDISKAMVAGADTVMLGNTLAGTDESPGQVLVKDGKKVKIIRGMAGYGANISKAQREKQQEDDVYLGLVPEGVEGNVPYKGPVAGILGQMIGGLRSGISYCGARTILEMRRNASFVRMTNAGLKESGSHDISKL